MQYSSVFIKARAIALSSISVLDLLWTVILCVVLFSQWTVLDVSERSLILVMLVTHSVTAVILLILLIAHFRPWLDAARMMFILAAQFGMAGAFVYYYSGFKCLNEATDQELGVCTLVIAFILIGSWITPILLVIYVFGLTLMLWRHRTMISKSLTVADQECGLEIIEVPSSIALSYRTPDSNHNSDPSASSGNSRHSQSTKASSIAELHDQIPVIAARLSKPPPVLRF